MSQLTGNYLKTLIRSRLALITIISALLIAGIPISAQASAFTLVGSWHIVDDNSGALFLSSFNAGRTYTVAQPSNGTSEAHGVWKSIGIGSYKTTDFAFIYDANGNITHRQKVRAKILLGANGQSLKARLIIDILQLDGTIVQTINTTATGKRINVE